VQQADDVYELVSQRITDGTSLIITANRAPQDWYGLFPNPVVTESLLDRLINTSHQAFMNGPSYRPNKRPKAKTPTHQLEAAPRGSRETRPLRSMRARYRSRLSIPRYAMERPLAEV
jgi:hypothetical protein